MTRTMVNELGGHKSRIDWIDFSSDSQFLLTCSKGENIRIWDLATSNIQHEIRCTPLYAVFSDRGTILVLESNSLLEYGITTAELISETPLNKDNQYRIVSSDGRLVLATQKTTNRNRRIHLTKLIDLENQSSIILDGPTELPESLLISMDHQWVAASYPRKSSFHLWNLNNPSKYNFKCVGHEQSVESLSFSSDCRWLVST
ncbi:MAG: hypothetical protein AAGA30_20940, partial [Planctomycetota bacterium]